MLRKKKLAYIYHMIAVVLALESPIGYAGAMGAVCTPENSTIPCEQKKWDFGAKALYLQVSKGPLSYPFYYLSNDTNKFVNENPWMWGFMIEGSYHLSTGKDINLNWYHDNSTAITRVGSAPISSTSNFVTEIGPLTLTGKRSWDAVNLEFGQHVDYGQSVAVRYHAGFEYVHIGYTGIIQAYGSAPVIFNTTRALHYSGFGPRVGADVNYALGYGLTPYINGAVALSAGSSKFNYRTSSRPPIYGRSGAAINVVPEMELKAGLKYTYPTQYGDISVDGGWMWINYIDALQYGDDDFAHTAHFALQGPYFGFKWLGNIA